MTTKTTTITMVVMFAIGVAFIGMPDAEAKAVDDKLIKIAEKYAETKEKKKTATSTDKAKLDKEEKDIVKYLNRQGIPTIEQWHENKKYWIEKRHNVLESERDNAKNTSYQQISYESQIHEICGCKDGLRVKAGYAVPYLGLMWNTYASSWTDIGVGQNNYSLILFDDNVNDSVEHFHISKSKTTPKTIDFDVEYTAEDASGWLIDDRTSYHTNLYSFWWSQYQEDESALNDVETDSEFKFSVDVNSIY